MSFKRIDISTSDKKKLIGVKELQAYLSIGRSTAEKIGIAAGAKRKVGRRALYDVEAIDRYVDSLGA